MRRISITCIITVLLVVYLCGCIVMTYMLNWAKDTTTKAQIFHDRGIFFILEDYNHNVWLSVPFQFNYYEKGAWIKL